MLIMDSREGLLNLVANIIPLSLFEWLRSWPYSDILVLSFQKTSYTMPRKSRVHWTNNIHETHDSVGETESAKQST